MNHGFYALYPNKHLNVPSRFDPKPGEKEALYARSGRAVAELGLRNPDRLDVPCPKCFGAGSVIVASDGERLDRFTSELPEGRGWQLTGCDACRGGGSIIGATVHDARKAYRRLRAKTCRLTGMKRAEFDDNAGRIIRVVKRTRRFVGLRADHPGHWVRAAIEVAQDSGVQP